MQSKPTFCFVVLSSVALGRFSCSVLPETILQLGKCPRHLVWVPSLPDVVTLITEVWHPGRSILLAESIWSVDPGVGLT